MTEENVSPAAGSGKPPVASVTRETTVLISFADEAEPSISLTEEEARIVYSQLRKWYGRGK